MRLSVSRIIPARAGFTRSCVSWWPPAGDHPRSRGVYHLRRGRAGAGGGSSPLARGLHEGGTRFPTARRIIPARAGFTRRKSIIHSTVSDHPRSRGVYAATLRTRAWRTGSSPLARGLHLRSLLGLLAHGIIPARAGFTRSTLFIPPRGVDHPRSRGVYAGLPRPVVRVMGSSPLARGLRESRDVGIINAGIIPARAGFTVAAGTIGDRRMDHPRSRGVYGTGAPPN